MLIWILLKRRGDGLGRLLGSDTDSEVGNGKHFDRDGHGANGCDSLEKKCGGREKKG